ncbi:hypothetical protein HHK36_011564 [Tetracentron sinense]|uniref:ENT domain-containing protein n=1 Tax=Tetracentron sinense TaxID=13715 RepID=A0A834ZAK6_TETSI|nr:hypothetical protein HHK36_011564 [Tetracentron sinense]
MDAMDMKFQIHCIETEAYSAVLRAFIAQSDVLSWDKEGLITELRKELNVTDLEHRELLMKVDSDDSVRVIRGWRKGTAYEQESLFSKMNAPASVPGLMGHASHKRLKTSHAAVKSSSKCISHAPPSSAAIPASFSTHFRDGQLGGEMAIFSAQGNIGHSVKAVGHNRQTASVSKGRGPVIVQSKKGFVSSDAENLKKGSDKIEIRPTDKLIHEIETVIYGGETDPVQFENAKLILREHERSILVALDKLADVSDDDGSPNQLRRQYPHEELRRNGDGTSTHHALYGQVDRLNNYFSEGFCGDHTDRAGMPCVDAQDDEVTP